MTEVVRFIHAADLHLGAPFSGVSAQDPEVGAVLAEATYVAFERVIDACVEHAVDFLVLAGDVFDSGERGTRARMRFRTQMMRLEDAGIRAYVAQGNHDPASDFPIDTSLPGNVRFFPTGEVGRFEHDRDGDVVCALYGRGYAKKAETGKFAAGYRRLPEDGLAIGVLHANVGGNTDYEPYAPCSLDDLRAARMDYWALGHIHKREVLSESPLIVYAGSPQGVNPKEQGDHGCWLVELAPGGSSNATFIETDAVAWWQGAVDVAECETLDDVLERVRRHCAAIREAAAGKPAVARLDLTGRTSAHPELIRPGVLEEALDELRSEQLVEEPWVWIGRLRDRTRAAIDLDAVRNEPTFAADLVSIADSLLGDEDEASRVIDDSLVRVRTTLSGLRIDIEPMAVVERARDLCLDRLLAGGDEA